MVFWRETRSASTKLNCHQFVTISSTGKTQKKWKDLGVTYDFYFRPKLRKRKPAKKPNIRVGHPSSTYVNNLNISENYTSNGRFSSHLGGEFITFRNTLTLSRRLLRHEQAGWWVWLGALLQASVKEDWKGVARSFSIYFHRFLYLLLGLLHGVVKRAPDLDRWSDHKILPEGWRVWVEEKPTSLKESQKTATYFFR